MLVIGLTGGIGSGKSTVSELFAELGVPVVDMDVIAREVVEPGKPGLEEITREFGPGILDTAGRLDRAALREQVFASQEKREKLEAILHPLIRQQAEQEIAGLQAPYCILVIPLLAESAQPFPVDRILVVDVPESVQIERTMTRDHSSEADVRKILEAQAARKTRLKLADDVIHNTGNRDALRKKVSELHRFYLKLATATTN